MDSLTTILLLPKLIFSAEFVFQEEGKKVATSMTKIEILFEYTTKMHLPSETSLKTKCHMSSVTYHLEVRQVAQPLKEVPHVCSYKNTLMPTRTSNSPVPIFCYYSASE